MTTEKKTKNLPDVMDSGVMEAYIRFNDDLEKDYCFQLGVNKTFRDLLKIFEKLPISLRPNVFYNKIPKGFVVSTAPGFLTENGSLLFGFETNWEKFRKPVSLDDVVSEKIWPGQLILPVWEFKSFNFYAFVTFLLCWLYTDLPDRISPTPGLSLSTLFLVYLAKLCDRYDADNYALVVRELLEQDSVILDVVFFSLHVLKVLVIFIVFSLGILNPLHFGFPKRGEDKITKEELLDIGWTGSSRIPPDEYRDFYRSYRIELAGGLLQAHRSGVLDKLETLGVYLGEGEGFNTPRNANVKPQEGQFVLSNDYLTLLGEYLVSYLVSDDVDLPRFVKEFRKYGLLHCSDQISLIIQERKKYGDTPPKDNKKN